MLDNLYTVTGQRTEGAEHLFGVRLHGAHPLFDGHFPGQPVLPGVCTLAIVRQCVARVEGRKIRFEEIRECKFTAMVDPRTTSELEIRFTATDGNLQGTVAAEERTVLKIKAKYTPADD